MVCGVLADGKISSFSTEMLDNMEQYGKVFLIIANIKSIVKAIIFSTVYICILLLIFARRWINKNLQLENNERKNNVKQLMIVFFIIIILEILVNIGTNMIEGNIQIPVNIVLEYNVTSAQKQKIESKLNTMDEIIKYEYKSKTDALSEVSEKMGELAYLLDKDRNILPESYTITIYYKHKEALINELEDLNGIKSIKSWP